MKKGIWFIVILLLFNSCVIIASSDSFETWAKNGIGHQSAANYGHYLFLVKNELSSISLYDLEEKKLLYTLSLSPRDEKRGKSVVYHCNQCCFGKEKLQKGDMFPLLYISQRSPKASTGAFLDVLRIVPFMGKSGIVDSFHVEQVQKIFFPVMTDDNSMGSPNAVIDITNGYLYTYSRNNNAKAFNYHQTVISKFSLPPLRNKYGKIQAEIKMNDSDILDSFNCGFSLLHAQGGFYHNGKIYFVQGYPSKNEKLNYVFFREIDLKKRRLTKTVDMLSDGFKAEPEGCWYYKGFVMIGGNGRKIYKLTGKKYKVK